ncbi:MAG: F0F1 ATP synthase subunit epsilon, partial [Alphaproteobacteria bacterium]|nr:F0F1 ATP synthase subunit epsilon [Alphaproteobacteria bacterium]
MADKLHFELVSPEKLLMSLGVDMVVVPGVDGDFGVLINHAPVVSTLRTGILEVHNGDTPEK